MERLIEQGDFNTEIVEHDPETRQDIYKTRVARFDLADVSITVKEACGHLRDALDHAVYACALCFHGGVPKDTGFPFAIDANGVTGELNSRRLAGNPIQIRPLLASFEPYKGGNDLLFGLNQIRNPNTHRTIVQSAQAAVASRSELKRGRLSGGAFQFGYSKWDPDKNEVEYMRVPHGSEVDYDFTVSHRIVFGDVPMLGGEEVISTLEEITTEVAQVVTEIERETIRLLPTS